LRAVVGGHGPPACRLMEISVAVSVAQLRNQTIETTDVLEFVGRSSRI
jgi:hypothetical protein